METALRMEWRHFEALAAAIWKRRGFDACYCTPGANDNGVDVVAIQGKIGVLIQTKTSGTEGIRLGWETVKDVVAGEAFYRRRHPDVTFHKVGLTNQFFNQQAYEQAQLNNVELLEQPHLAELLATHPVSMLDVERLLYTDWGHPDG